MKLAPGNKVFMGRYHVEEAVAYAQRWLKMPRSRAPTAVVLANDVMAIAFMRTLQAQGVSIPKDVSVMGFDDIPAASLYWPGLTTVRQELRNMGAQACRALMATLEHEKVDRSVVEFPMQLVVRESTGQAP